jgi:hypothetical protein
MVVCALPLTQAKTPRSTGALLSTQGLEVVSPGVFSRAAAAECSRRREPTGSDNNPSSAAQRRHTLVLSPLRGWSWIGVLFHGLTPTATLCRRCAAEDKRWLTRVRLLCRYEWYRGEGSQITPLAPVLRGEGSQITPLAPVLRGEGSQITPLAPVLRGEGSQITPLARVLRGEGLGVRGVSASLKRKLL